MCLFVFVNMKYEAIEISCHEGGMCNDDLTLHRYL